VEINQITSGVVLKINANYFIYIYIYIILLLFLPCSRSCTCPNTWNLKRKVAELGNLEFAF
jgi:hypothetical protein